MLQRLDRVVDSGLFPNRSQAIEAAVMEKLERLARRRLAGECAKLDPAVEQISIRPAVVVEGLNEIIGV